MNLKCRLLVFATASPWPCTAALKHQLFFNSWDIGFHRALQDSLTITGDCSVCVERIDDARDCLLECKNVNGADGDSLLESCLRNEAVEDLEDLANCCGLDCEDPMKKAALCLNRCLDGCLSETSSAWYQCVVAASGNQGCTQQECLDVLSTHVQDTMDTRNKTNIFSPENIEKRLTNVEMDDLGDCSLLNKFVDAACRLGDECCDQCQEELASTLDCLINDIVAPFVAASLNATIPECPVAEDCSTNPTRALTEKEDGLFHRALGLPKSERSGKKEVFLKKVKEQRDRRLEQGAVPTGVIAGCRARMKADVVAYNMTEAANNYLVCINSAVFATLEDEPSAAFAGTSLKKLATLGGASLIVALLVLA